MVSMVSRRGAGAQGRRCRGREFSDSSFKPGSIRTRTGEGLSSAERVHGFEYEYEYEYEFEYEFEYE